MWYTVVVVLQNTTYFKLGKTGENNYRERGVFKLKVEKLGFLGIVFKTSRHIGVQLTFTPFFRSLRVGYKVSFHVMIG